MQKYIAVVNPRMDEDEISKVITSGVAGALFSISHQNYPLAAKLIRQVKELSYKHNRPVSIIQDVTQMQDPLDLQFGIRSGADWIVASEPHHVKVARGLDKLIPIIWKGQNPPKGVGSVMDKGLSDPDAEVGGSKWQVKHLDVKHAKQNILDTLMNVATHSHTTGIIVSDLHVAQALSQMRLDQKIIFASDNQHDLGKAGLYHGVYPVFAGKNVTMGHIHSHILKPGERVLDARDIQHVAISSLS